MSEWKRIFLNRIWLGTAALSLLFSLVIYATAQSSRVGSSVLAYREHTNQWTQILSVVSPEDGLALLERENQTLQGWNTARMLVQLEEWQGQIDEEILNRYREQYENLDEMLHAVRSETAPELDIAAQESVARWIDRLVYQMGYAEFVQSVSTQAAAIRRSPMFSDSNTFVYRNADRTEADYLSTTEIHLKLLPCDVVESVLENHVAMVFSLFLMMVTIALIVEPKRLGLEALEQSCASGRETLAGWRIGAVAVSAVVTTVLMQGGMFLLGMLLYQQPIALNAPVQSIPLLQHWAAPTTVGVFLLWYLLFSAAGLWAIGLLLWLVLSRMPSLPVGLTLCGGILFLEYNWIQRYGVNDALYPLSGFNLFRLLFPAEAAERYLNYNLFGFPVRERTALSIILATLILACSTVILLSVHFALGNRKNGTVAKAFYALANRVHLSCRPKPALVYEAKKLLLYSGGLLFLAVAVVFLQTQMAPPISQSMQESQLTQYVCTYAGPVDKEVLVQIKIDRQGAAQIYAEASEDESKALFLEYYAARCWALDELSIRYEELLDLQTAGEKGLKLVNELPFDQIYGETGANFRLASACAALLALCLTIPGVFWLERRYGMELVLLSTPTGRNTLWRWKVILVLCVSAVIWLAWSWHELFLFQRLGGSWDVCLSNAASLHHWDSRLGSGSLLAYLLSFYGFRLAGLLSAGSVVMWISSIFSSLLPAAGISVLVLLFPTLLTQMDVSFLEYVSWAVKLMGNGLAIHWTDALCLGLWIAMGAAALAASRHQWRRYRG